MTYGCRLSLVKTPTYSPLQPLCATCTCSTATPGLCGPLTVDKKQLVSHGSKANVSAATCGSENPSVGHVFWRSTPRPYKERVA
jgi:hypothetical protein